MTPEMMHSAALTPEQESILEDLRSYRETKEDIIELYDETILEARKLGCSLRAIGEAAGISNVAIHYRVKETGL